MVTAVLASPAAGVLAAVVFDHLLVAGLLVWLRRLQASTWERVSTAPLFADEEAAPR